MINTYNCDYRELFANTADKAYDLAIVDVPYGINRDRQSNTVCKKPKHNRKKFEKKDWDSETPTKEYFDELFRVSKNQIMWGANYFPQYLPPSMGWIVWDKGQKLSMSDGELAFSSFDKALRIVTINRGVLAKNGGTIHPTEKPIELYEYLLKNYAKVGDKILDTHGGSFSHAIAAHNLGFDLDICEIDAEYYEKGVNRLKIYQSQVSMF